MYCVIFGAGVAGSRLYVIGRTGALYSDAYQQDKYVPYDTLSMEEFVPAVDPAKQITSITYNADGTVNIITFDDASTETMVYTAGQLTSITYG